MPAQGVVFLFFFLETALTQTTKRCFLYIALSIVARSFEHAQRKSWMEKKLFPFFFKILFFLTSPRVPFSCPYLPPDPRTSWATRTPARLPEPLPG